MATSIDQLIAEIRSLPAGDQERVRQALQQPPGGQPAPPAATDEQALEEEFKRRLLAKGLLGEIKPPVRDLAPYRKRKLFEIEGKPLSETIIEERR